MPKANLFMEANKKNGKIYDLLLNQPPPPPHRYIRTFLVTFGQKRSGFQG